MTLESKGYVINLDPRRVIFNNAINRLRKPISESSKKYSKYEIAKLIPLINLMLDVSMEIKEYKALLDYQKKHKLDTSTFQTVLKAVNQSLMNWNNHPEK